MKKMTKTRRALSAAVMGVVASGVAAPSQADLFAYANIYFENFLILGSDLQPLDYATDFISIAPTSSADYDGALTGTPGFGATVPNGDDIDFPADCLSTTGDCNPLTENAFALITKDDAAGMDYVAADQLQEGSPISNTPNFDPIPGATIGSQAVGSLSDTEAEGSSNVNNALETSFQFSLTQDQGISFSADFTTYVEAFASAGEIFPGKATAAVEQTFTITNVLTNEVVFSATPDLLNSSTAANANDFAFDIRTCGDYAVAGNCGTPLVTPFFITTDPLTAGTLYQLSLRTNANIDIARVRQVPEPGTLALFGLGILGLALGNRRRRA